MHYYTDVLKKYAVFSGRARSQEYWMYILFNALIVLVLWLVSLVGGNADRLFKAGLEPMEVKS